MNDNSDGHKIERGLYAVATAVEALAGAVRALGNNDACTPMGGLEALGAANLEAAKMIQSGLEDMARAIQEKA